MKVAVALGSCIGLLLVVVVSDDLPTQSSTLFSGSGRCESCHSAGSATAGPMRDADGGDISPVTLWRSTVMANAAKDPIWQAKVAAEVSENPSLQSIIEDKCTTCHTPLARTEAVYLGATGYSMAEAVTDPLAMDGVSCTLCHQIQASNLGTPGSFSGGFAIDDTRIIFGPYDNVLSTVMEMSVNYSAELGAHLSGSELCATCHTLFTPTIDNSGQIVGEIAEQTPYLEWLNSRYSADGVECQTCHVPDAAETTAISTIPPGLVERGPFSRHYFVGGNMPLLRMLRENSESIGVAADSDQLDSTMARTLNQLQRRTAELSATYRWLDADTLEVIMTVRNRTGHKFPTGFPSRRAWLHVLLSDAGAATVFESGEWDTETGDIAQLDEPFEPHHDVVTDDGQVVVYQSLMGDLAGELTWTLLRGASYLKDNRLPPEGFTTEGAAYDSTAVIGNALFDPNFNRENGVEGSGSDQIVFRIGGLERAAGYTLSARLMYQALSSGFVKDLVEYEGPEVDRFRDFFGRTDSSPVTVDSLGLSITSTGIADFGESALLDVDLYPHPAVGSVTVTIDGAVGPIRILVYDLAGREVARLRAGAAGDGSGSVVFDTSHLPDGVYLYRVSSGRRQSTGSIVLVR